MIDKKKLREAADNRSMSQHGYAGHKYTVETFECGAKWGYEQAQKELIRMDHLLLDHAERILYLNDDIEMLEFRIELLREALDKADKACNNVMGYWDLKIVKPKQIIAEALAADNKVKEEE